MSHVLLGKVSHSDKPHAPNNQCNEGSLHGSLELSYIHVYLFYPHKSRMMGMLLKNWPWRLWQGELGIHSLDIIIVLYQNSQNEVMYEQVQDTQHDTTDLKVCCYHDKYNVCIHNNYRMWGVK